MRIKCGTEALVNGLGYLAPQLAEWRFMDGTFVHVIGTDSSFVFVSYITLKYIGMIPKSLPIGMYTVRKAPLRPPSKRKEEL